MKAAVVLGCRVLVTLVCLAPPVSVAQDHWPEFRGPTGDGHAATAKLPVKIDESVVKWKTPIHGKGWSSPVVWGERVWLTTATVDGKKMSAMSVDLRSGEILHDILIQENEDPDFCHAENSYASPTPVIDEKFVYLHFGKYATVCLDHQTGKEVWRRSDLECDHFRGPASSPILFEDRLIVAFDGFDQQYVVALDKVTGDTIWKTHREINYGTDNGDLKKAYCTASVIEVAGEPLLICPSAIATVAYNPRNGEPVWTVYHGGMNASSRPIASKGRVFLTNGTGRMVAVRLGDLNAGKGEHKGEGGDAGEDESKGENRDITKTHIAWERRKIVPKKTSLLLVDGSLYLVSDDGVLACVDPATGDDIWRERTSATYAASPVFADGKIYFFSRDGDVITLRPGRTFEVLAKSKLGEGFWASPAIVGNRMVLRSKSHLFCVE